MRKMSQLRHTNERQKEEREREESNREGERGWKEEKLSVRDGKMRKQESDGGVIYSRVESRSLDCNNAK